MPELFLIENPEADKKLFLKSHEIFLHDNIQELLFKYKKDMCNIFENIRGTFLIDHMAVTIIDPDNTLLIFSTTPSVEYNLISQELWKYDKTFSSYYQMTNVFYSWEQAYEEVWFEQLKMIKQTRHGFFFGFNLSKKMGSSQLIYSFATRHIKSDMFEYYRGHINDLFSIGDYCYTSINDLYKKYNKTKRSTSADGTKLFSPFLKLIKNKKWD